MGFFDNLGKKASKAYDVTAEKTGKLAKEAKFRMKINENKSDINDLYKEIGKKVYEKHVREEEICIKEDLEEQCTKIDVLSDEIESLLKECLELKDRKQCQRCYKEIEKDVKFCPNCGKKQDTTPAKEVEILKDLEKSEVNQNNQTEKQIVKENLEQNIKNNEDNKEEKVNLEKTVEVESNVNSEENK